MRWVAIFAVVFSFVFFTKVYAESGIISPLADSFESPPVAPVVVTAESGSPAILGVQTSLSEAVSRYINATPTPTPPLPETTPAPSPTPFAHKSRKQAMTITLLGDSMIDTLGPDGGGLAKRLGAFYPDTQFTVINHGVGGENIDTGVNHLTNGYQYLGAVRPSVISQSPDVLVVESYGYNPYPYNEGALDKHWLQLAAIVDSVHTNLPDTRILIAATIAPNWDVFGDGAPFINFSAQGKRDKVSVIDSYIESTIGFAKTEHLPLSDAYHKSRGSDGNGILRYINPGDHIHYSDEGRSLMSQTIADSIVTNRLLE